MCGISCVVKLRGHAYKSSGEQTTDVQRAYENDKALLSQQLESSLDAINHRGPDGRGSWFSDHNRVGM